MPNRLSFQLAKDDLRLIEDAIHHAPQPELRQRALALRMLHLGYSVDEAAEISDVTPTVIRRWRRAWPGNRVLPGFASWNPKRRGD